MSTIAILAPGAMGSAVGQRLATHGARVLTSTQGRSAATAARARTAGMIEATLEEIASADLLLSIVPPGEAVGLAGQLAPFLARSQTKAVFVDCNAINPATMDEVVRTLEGTGCNVVDAAIIGLPPQADNPGTVFYISGDVGKRCRPLAELGLRLSFMEAPVGTASALKMTYAGINKGLTAIASAMLLAASRHGFVDSLCDQLAESQPHLLARFRKYIPDMYPKAYRWVAEMREIAGFLGPDDPAALMFEGAARFYERIAANHGAGGEITALLDAALK